MKTLNNTTASMKFINGLLSINIGGISISINPTEAKNSIGVLESILLNLARAKSGNNIEFEENIKTKFRKDADKIEAILDIFSLYKGEFDCVYTIDPNGTINTKFNGDISINIVSIVNQLLKLEE